MRINVSYRQVSAPATVYRRSEKRDPGIQKKYITTRWIMKSSILCWVGGLSPGQPQCCRGHQNHLTLVQILCSPERLLAEIRSPTLWSRRVAPRWKTLRDLQADGLRGRQRGMYDAVPLRYYQIQQISQGAVHWSFSSSFFPCWNVSGPCVDQSMPSPAEGCTFLRSIDRPLLSGRGLLPRFEQCHCSGLSAVEAEVSGQTRTPRAAMFFPRDAAFSRGCFPCPSWTWGLVSPVELLSPDWARPSESLRDVVGELAETLASETWEVWDAVSDPRCKANKQRLVTKRQDMAQKKKKYTQGQTAFCFRKTLEAVKILHFLVAVIKCVLLMSHFCFSWHLLNQF